MGTKDTWGIRAERFDKIFRSYSDRFTFNGKGFVVSTNIPRLKCFLGLHIISLLLIDDPHGHVEMYGGFLKKSISTQIKGQVPIKKSISTQIKGQVPILCNYKSCVFEKPSYRLVLEK